MCLGAFGVYFVTYLPTLRRYLTLLRDLLAWKSAFGYLRIHVVATGFCPKWAQPG